MKLSFKFYLFIAGMKGSKMSQKITTKVKLFFLVLTLFAVKASQAQWLPDVRLTNNAASSFMSGTNVKCLASSDNILHVVWFDNRDGNSEIYYKRSIDGGVNWGADTRLTYNTAASLFPSVSVLGSVVHLVWEEYRDGYPEIYYKRSTNEGISWEADRRLTYNAANSFNPSISIWGSVIHLVWFDDRDGNREIYYKRSSDEGINWGADIRLTNNYANSQFPSISVSGSEIHVVWEEYRDGNSEIYYKRSPDGGISWGYDIRLTNNYAKSLSTDVSASGSVVHVVWFDERDGNQEIYYKHSTDGGISWCPDTRLTINYAISKFSSILSSDLAVHVFWEDNRDGNFEIYYKRSTDEGTNWGADTRITNDYATSIFPFVSVSGPIMHIIWEEYRDGNAEVYYKRDPTGNPEPININISVIVEGFYNSYTNKLNMKDIVRAYLRNTTIPYSIVDSAESIIDSLTFTGSFSFNNAPSGLYYIILKHRNSIETWSKSGGESLTKGATISYSFTNAITQAFGNNMKQVDISPIRFALYSGDVDQDGIVDASDLSLVYNASNNSAWGYLPEDVTGNNFVNVEDLSIVYNNFKHSVIKVTPPEKLFHNKEL